MIKPLLMPLSWLAFTVAVCATPDREIDVEEQFLGSNAEGFALIRTESDNLGSYYSGRGKRYLDEYVKLPTREGYSLAIAKRVKTTLILDTTHNHDPDANDSEAVNAEDSSIALASLLKKYPVRGRKWSGDQAGKLKTEGKEAAVYAGNLSVVSNWELTTDIFGFESGKVEWSLEEVIEDMNCIYLKVSTGSEDTSTQTRWICNVPRKSRQIRDHLDLKPLCLCSGNFNTAAEAIERAHSILTKANESKQPLYGLQIWSVHQDSGKEAFKLVLQDAIKEIEPEKFERLKLLIGPDLAPTSTRRFNERIEIPASR